MVWFPCCFGGHTVALETEARVQSLDLHRCWDSPREHGGTPLASTGPSKVFLADLDLVALKHLNCNQSPESQSKLQHLQENAPEPQQQKRPLHGHDPAAGDSDSGFGLPSDEGTCVCSTTTTIATTAAAVTAPPEAGWLMQQPEEQFQSGPAGRPGHEAPCIGAGSSPGVVEAAAESQAAAISAATAPADRRLLASCRSLSQSAVSRTQSLSSQRVSRMAGVVQPAGGGFSSTSFARRDNRIHPVELAAAEAGCTAAVGSTTVCNGWCSGGGCGGESAVQQHQQQRLLQALGVGLGSKLQGSGSLLRKQQTDDPLETSLLIVRNGTTASGNTTTSGGAADAAGATEPSGDPAQPLHGWLQSSNVQPTNPTNHEVDSPQRAPTRPPGGIGRQWLSFSHAEGTACKQQQQQRRSRLGYVPVPTTAAAAATMAAGVQVEREGSWLGPVDGGEGAGKGGVLLPGQPQVEEGEDGKESREEKAEEEGNDPRVGSLASARRWVSFPRATPSYSRHSQPSDAALEKLRAEFAPAPHPNVPASTSPRASLEASPGRGGPLGSPQGSPHGAGGSGDACRTTASPDDPSCSTGSGAGDGAGRLGRQASRRALMRAPSHRGGGGCGGADGGDGGCETESGEAGGTDGEGGRTGGMAGSGFVTECPGAVPGAVGAGGGGGSSSRTGKDGSEERSETRSEGGSRSGGASLGEDAEEQERQQQQQLRRHVGSGSLITPTVLPQILPASTLPFRSGGGRGRFSITSSCFIGAPHADPSTMAPTGLGQGSSGAYNTALASNFSRSANGWGANGAGCVEAAMPAIAAAGADAAAAAADWHPSWTSRPLSLGGAAAPSMKGRVLAAVAGSSTLHGGIDDGDSWGTYSHQDQQEHEVCSIEDEEDDEAEEARLQVEGRSASFRWQQSRNMQPQRSILKKDSLGHPHSSAAAHTLATASTSSPHPAILTASTASGSGATAPAPAAACCGALFDPSWPHTPEQQQQQEQQQRQQPGRGNGGWMASPDAAAEEGSGSCAMGEADDLPGGCRGFSRALGQSQPSCNSSGAGRQRVGKVVSFQSNLEVEGGAWGGSGGACDSSGCGAGMATL